MDRQDEQVPSNTPRQRFAVWEVFGAFLGLGLTLGALPFWDRLRRNSAMRGAMLGINAAVVGLLLAAFYNPVWTSAIGSRIDFGLAVIAFLGLVWWRIPPWLVVLATALVTGFGVGGEVRKACCILQGPKGAFQPHSSDRLHGILAVTLTVWNWPVPPVAEAQQDVRSRGIADVQGLPANVGNRSGCALR